MKNHLSEKVSHLPTQPGVYLFKDASQTVLYVGKAINLRSRVGSYFSSKHLDRPWITVKIGLIADVETIVVNNELEALILEASLIGDYQPKFNIKLTDDKSYPYLRLTINELFPRLEVVRKRTRDGAKYFGPYLSAWSARLTGEFLRRIYGLHMSHRPLATNHDRRCLNCQLEANRCPLAGQISPEDYAVQVKKTIEFLEGKRQSLARDIETRMQSAAESQQFELAGKLRDQLRAVKHVTADQNVTGEADSSFDVIAAAKAGLKAVVTVMFVRDGSLTGQKQFHFETIADQTEGEIIHQFIIDFYHNFQSVPRLVVLAEAIEDQELISNWLKSTFGQAVELRHALRGEKAEFVLLAKKNAEAKLESSLLKNPQDFAPLIALKELLNLSGLPVRIEAVDISNLGTSEAVGATICFINGQPDKNEYRRYKIKTVEGQNDFAMIREVTARRFADTSRPRPDLYVVDGGPEQLKFAIEGLGYIKDQLIISLAKKPDRIFLPGKKLPIKVSRGNKELLLLGRIRDETHRFVIGYQRKRQSKKSLDIN